MYCASRRLLLVGWSAHLTVWSAIGFKSILSAVTPIVHFCNRHTIQANTRLNLSGLSLSARLSLWWRWSMHMMCVGVHCCKWTELVLRWEGHVGINGWSRSRSVGCPCWTRVVLGSTPRKTNARVSDGVALHLVDC